ncbi:alpha/beta hydrolase [Aromatoleum petrolei]|uniref:Alpha/beta fold hydrolase n=1 Tax=Aromatoleum petrolei TaxID=76116 RepID=A0ABX1MRI3_9RHOO|nr:alpha/beta hydrolase [Aromatoleum petrolei]NMF90578.1 alpha/beta fold hydrolase [Aromatoleum petrolei]QTQ36799.1 Alpha/beta hydrolase fold domain-containing protein [Aromatoleum petrolei]
MNPAAQTVVLVHGLWMHGVVFGLLRRRLERAGFVTRTWSYPSVRQGLAANADALACFLATLPGGPIHLVGHSLGGIIVASALARHPDPRVRRCVLMGTPWTTSRSATGLQRVPGMSVLIGRSLRDWLAAPRPALPGIDVGVISGSRPLGLAGFLVGLPRPHDGIVMVDETRVAGARDAVTLRVSHMEMLLSARCADQVLSFLRTGSFTHDMPDHHAGQGIRP